MNSAFSLPSMLEHGGDAYATFENDPIFTPLFIAAGFTGTMTVGIFTISTATVASAIATTSLISGVQFL